MNFFILNFEIFFYGLGKMSIAEIANTTNSKNLIPVTRLTALWALSESVLGGLLHAVHIPLRGMIISSAAVIIICLIAHFSEKKGTILKSTIIVLVIKGAISPHTPFAAYLSVFMQGFLGELIFYKRRFYVLSSVLLGIIVGILTGLQRFITFTLIFGATLWDALNQFINYAVNEFLSTSHDPVSINFIVILVTLYVLIHLIFGLAAGLFASKFPSKLNSNDFRELLISKSVLNEMNQASSLETKRKKKKWWKKPIYATIFISLAILLIIAYVNPQAINLSQKSILLMLIRSILIISIWFLFLSPLLLKLIRKFLIKRQTAYASEIKNILNHIPKYKSIVAQIWKSSKKFKGLKKLNFFLSGLIINILTVEISD